MTDSLRARTLINLSAVLYEQSAARPGLLAKVSNIDLDFVPDVAFISDVYMADSLRARTLINLSAVLLRARTLINLSAVLYEQAAVSIIDLNFVPSIAFDAIGNVELIGDLLGDADCVNNNNNNERTALLAKRIKTNEDRKKSTHFRDNIEELICVSKVKNNRNNLNIIVTDPTGREFGRVDMKSSTGFKFYKGKNIQLLRPADVANVFDTVVSKSDEVPTRELSSYIKTELLCDNSRKFYRLVITSEDTHCKQIIKKAYIMLPERALLILFII
ncbi:hypothetical protein HBI22_193910 [Parastagonospora nodorum]|nr:hypothetical protein HBI28_170810 [Parastagonospora nodorum]KAH5621589.1 hypothetical protein HBI22_193910 [Parastagonospora nodorum]